MSSENGGVVDEFKPSYYKQPEPNQHLYKFDKKDNENIKVLQRFQKRPASQVTDGGRAYQAGIKLGDTIVKINDNDTKRMTLAEAHQQIQEAQNDLKLSVKKY